MSAKVKLRGKLPGDEAINGVDAMVDELLATPEKVRAYLVLADVDSITDNVATGERVPRLEARRIECLGEADSLSAEIKDLFLRLAEKRTGKAPLPIDWTESDAATDGTGPV